MEVKEGIEGVKLQPVTVMGAVKKFTTKRRAAEMKFILLSKRGKGQCIASHSQITYHLLAFLCTPRGASAFKEQAIEVAK